MVTVIIKEDEKKEYETQCDIALSMTVKRDASGGSDCRAMMIGKMQPAQMISDIALTMNEVINEIAIRTHNKEEVLKTLFFCEIFEKDSMNVRTVSEALALYGGKSCTEK